MIDGPAALSRRPAFKVPRFDDAEPEVVALALALDREVSGVGADFTNLPPPADCLRGPALEHRLSGHFTGQAPLPLDWSRSEREAEIARRIAPPSPGGLTDWLAVATAPWGLSPALRESRIGTSRDSTGRRVAFPPPSQMMRALSCLERRLADPGPSRAFDAITTLVLLTHCHPLADGNGRAGRLLFHCVLHGPQASRAAYLPLYEIAACSNGGYILSVREAELRNRWQPLFQWMVAASRFSRSLRHLNEKAA